MAAQQNYFHPWQSSPKIGSSLKIIWEMSDENNRGKTSLCRKFELQSMKGEKFSSCQPVQRARCLTELSCLL